MNMPFATLPIAYRLEREPADESTVGALLAPPGWLTRTRALEGMQKEALVVDEASRNCWRLLCDEGPWLNGTDLAPFPLGYFAAGLASCLFADLCAAGNGPAPAESLQARLDIHFTMEGSILRGTMMAGVEAIVLTLDDDSGTGTAALGDWARSVLDGNSPARQTLAAHLPGRFVLAVNGESVDWPGEPAAALAEATDPADMLSTQSPPAEPATAEPLVIKDAEAEAASEGGAVGLQSEQKRTVHIAAEARLRPDGLQELTARCVHPAGSRFRFLATAGSGDDRAPPGPAYLSAGIAFCFMTQLGRYAQIRKLPLSGYRIVQRTAFSREGPVPVETAVFLDSEDTPESNRKMVQMGEQTCYVHTTLREPQPLAIRTTSDKDRPE